MPNLMDAQNVLKRIADYKAGEVRELEKQVTIEELRTLARALPPPRGFRDALQSTRGTALIAEVKKASPSKGLIRPDFDPVAIAKAYEAAGAACLSVLTDGPGFQGSSAIFKQVRAATTLPMLRKDFMIDPIQIAESAALGADCILIILAMIDDTTAQSLMEEAARLNLDALVETHDADEIRRAVGLSATFIGINNRNLRTFETSLDNFTDLAPLTPPEAFLVAESGIFTPQDIGLLNAAGAHAYLIGESLMRADDVEAATRILLKT